ncbi:hypothetical protein GCM10027596_37170 [Nocardioides korecus]
MNADDHRSHDQDLSLPSATHVPPGRAAAGAPDHTAYGDPAPGDLGATAPPRRRVGMKTKVAAVAAAVVVTASGTAVALSASGSSTGSTASAAGGPGSSAQAGGAQGAAGGGSGNLGFSPTQYHLAGTITAISGNTVTLKTTSGTTTYTATGSTHLMVDQASATSLSAFKVGQSVVGSTTTSTGTTLNDLVSGMGGRGGAAGGAGGDTGTTTS